MNLFDIIEKGVDDEQFITILKNNAFEMGKIVSYGIPSPADFWYEDERAELVFVIDGSATIEFFNGKLVELSSGDSLNIGKMEKHRVSKVSNPCVWLAIKYA